MTRHTEEPIATSVQTDTFPAMTYPSDIKRRFSALALAMLKASDTDPDIRSVRAKTLQAVERNPTPPPRALVEDLLISASALFLGINPRPEQLLDHWDPEVVVHAIDAVTGALRRIAA